MSNPEIPQESHVGAVAWRIVQPYWSVVNIYGSPDDFLETFRLAPRNAGLLLAVRWCDSEVCNGGLHQFFYNPTGVLAPEAVEGLQSIGATRSSEIVAQAMRMFGRHYPRDHERRGLVLRTLERPRLGKSRAEWDPFHKLDNEYYASKSRDSLHRLMDRFASGEVGQAGPDVTQ
jgi:Domain of unknown function (DUF4375)